ncbi:MAG: hypothetical protein IKA82_02330 [Clostridia bacterium]|nr:hypothetical protein [Clostridia bacterium]
MMKTKLASTVLAGVAVVTAAGAVAVAGSKKHKAKKMARKTGKQLEMVGTVIQSIASMTK